MKTPIELIQSMLDMGVSQEDIARKSGLTPSCISLIKSGKRKNQSFATYQALQKAHEATKRKK